MVEDKSAEISLGLLTDEIPIHQRQASLFSSSAQTGKVENEFESEEQKGEKKGEAKEHS